MTYAWCERAHIGLPPFRDPLSGTAEVKVAARQVVGFDLVLLDQHGLVKLFVVELRRSAHRGRRGSRAARAVVIDLLCRRAHVHRRYGG